MHVRPKRLPDSDQLRVLTVRLPEEVKEALRGEAENRNVTIARLTTFIMAERFGLEGYDLPEEDMKT